MIDKGHGKNLKLTDLLQAEFLERIQDNYTKTSGIPVSLIDTEGNFLFGAGGADIFESMQRGDEVLSFCVRQKKSPKPVRFTSVEDGFLVGLVPVWLGGSHLGSWIVGPLPYEGGDAPACFEDAIDFFTALDNTLMKMSETNVAMAMANAELMEATERLELSAQMLSKFTETTDVSFCVSDFFTGKILMVNNQCAEFMGAEKEMLTDTACWDHFGREIWEELHDKLLGETGEPNPPYISEQFLPQRKIWLRFTSQALYWVNGHLAHLLSFIDITQSKEIEKHLSHLAFYDQDMDLPNAVKLLHDLDAIGSGDIGVICYDILSLRKINDVYSREVGDRLLLAIRDWISAQGVKGSRLYRVAGDQFCWLFHGVGFQQVLQYAHRLNKRFEEPWSFEINGESRHVFAGISSGVVDVSRFLTPQDNLLNLLERILDLAKGKKDAVVYDEEVDKKFKYQMELEQSLKNCVMQGMLGFSVYYQPIVSAGTGRWCGIEALCRWQSPEFGRIPPDVFIQVAEQAGLISAIDSWVLDTAVCQCKQWGLDECVDFFLDVNLSSIQLLEDMLVSDIVGILEKYDYPGSKLSLEITESTEFYFSEQSMNTVNKLRDMDIAVALDDFGTGYSSFNNLKNIPVKVLKTDRTFISNIESDTYLQYLLYVMAELAHAADMKLIVEGVETQEQLELLLLNRVDFMQGYLFAKPLPVDNMEKQLKNFFTVSPHMRSFSKVDIRRLLEEDNGYAPNPQMYRIYNRCLHQITSAGNTFDAVQGALTIIGESFGLSRVSVYLPVAASNLYEIEYAWAVWDSQFSVSDLLYTRVDADAEVTGWNSLFKKQLAIAISNISQLPEQCRIYMRARLVQSLAAFPFWKDGDIAGYVVYSDCKGSRDWQAEDLLMLYNLSSLIEFVIKKDKENGH